MKKGMIFLATLLVGLVVARSGWAAASVWTAGTGNWSTPANWDGGEPDASTSKARISNGGTAEIISPNDEACGTLEMGVFSGENGALEMGGGSLSAMYEFVGYYGTGTLTQTGGTTTLSYDLQLGKEYVSASSQGNGTYNLSGTGILSADREYVGYYGTGTFIQTGGTNEPNDLNVGYYNTANGTYELGGGDLLTSQVSVGYVGTGTFTHTDGNNTISGHLFLGENSGSGDYTLSGNGGLSASSEYVGNLGTGTFTQTGGTNTLSGSLILGNKTGSDGTYDLSMTGSISAAGAVIGMQGRATFTQTGGTNTLGGLTIGSASSAEGTYTISSGTLDVEDGKILVSGSGGGKGTLNLNGGTVIADRFWLGSNATFTSSGTSSVLRVNSLSGFGSSMSVAGSLQIGHAGDTGVGSYSLGAGESLSVGHDLVVGYDGTGTLSHHDGATTVTGSLYLGHSSGGDGTYSMSAGTLDVDGNLYVGSTGTGDFTVVGDDALIALAGFTQNENGTLRSLFDADGIATITVSGMAILGGIWNAVALGSAPLGTFDILTATGGISGTFDTTSLPSGDWSWGIDSGTTLWISHVPEPTTLWLLALGLPLLGRRRRSC